MLGAWSNRPVSEINFKVAMITFLRVSDVAFLIWRDSNPHIIPRRECVFTGDPSSAKRGVTTSSRVFLCGAYLGHLRRKCEGLSKTLHPGHSFFLSANENQLWALS